jgi:histidine triad (HIT) family protein
VSQTLFDKILAGDIPSNKVYEDEWIYAFKDITPQAPVHVLVIPKTKVARFVELKDRSVGEVGEFFSRVAKVADELGLAEAGFRIVINNGENAGQTVEYLHAHILGGAPLEGRMA